MIAYPLILKNDERASLNTKAIDELALSSSSPLLRNDFLKVIYSNDGGAYGAENLWYDIMMKGKEIMAENPSGDHLRAFEVGAQSSTQSLIAARAGFHAYCIEPSPKSFDRIYNQVVNEVSKDTNLAQYIHLFQVAAGSASNGELNFRTTGGTGDHVGEFVNF